MSDLLPRLSDYRTSLRDPYYLVYRRLFADLEDAAAQAKGDLLDIGCGNKPYERMFAGRVLTHTGCDLEQSTGQRVDILCPATSIPVADGSFDTVLCTQVIEHVADHGALLREAFRVLRPGGVLILSGPMYWHLHEEPYDFFRFTIHGFRFLLERSGFARTQVVPNGGKWALCGQVLIHCFSGTLLASSLVTRAINWTFARLDDRYPDGRNPLNYVVVAHKA